MEVSVIPQFQFELRRDATDILSLAVTGTSLSQRLSAASPVSIHGYLSP
jgi:hypothetical protein